MKLQAILITCFLLVIMAFVFPTFHSSITDANYTGVPEPVQTFFNNMPVLLITIIIITVFLVYWGMKRKEYFG